MTELKRRSEAEALRYILQKIADFPYVGEQAAQQMQLMAKGALAIDADTHAQQTLRCDRCGSSGDIFMMCAGCQSPLTSTDHCVTRCEAASRDGVICPDDSCDIDDGVRQTVSSTERGGAK